MRFRHGLLASALFAFAPGASGDELGAGEIMKVVSAHRSDIRRCYTDALKRTPNLSGKVRLRVVIAPSCVADTFMTFVFPKSDADTNLNVPFVFVPDTADAGARADASTRG